MAQLIDAHVHLDRVQSFDSFYQNLRCLIPGVNGEDHRHLATDFPQSFWATGIHPMHAGQEVDWARLEKLLASGDFVAVGECGLDRRWKNTEQQLFVFEKQIQLAKKLDLPLIIHAVGHLDLLLELYKKYHFKGMVHYFNFKSLPEILLKGELYFGFCSKLPPNSRAQKIFPRIPLDRLLIETDSDETGTAQEQELTQAYQQMAELYGITGETLTLQVEQNFKRLFRIN
ncbi:MAG: hypothetical protein COB67_03095 [SAR324 cluster bacterium]|uniref:Uncharacterized protein n=1 Tax=SAR324 cluster bacterium TaxID=2024889 RepID=A0A2A4T8S0_9DELT|nr:MAG: hypothetical protein COB67_03095 [SAR324 cluster bacterium]